MTFVEIAHCQLFVDYGRWLLRSTSKIRTSLPNTNPKQKTLATTPRDTYDGNTVLTFRATFRMLLTAALDCRASFASVRWLEIGSEQCHNSHERANTPS